MRKFISSATPPKETVTTEDINFIAMLKPGSIELSNSSKWLTSKKLYFQFSRSDVKEVIDDAPPTDVKVCALVKYGWIDGGFLEDKVEPAQTYDEAVEKVL